MIVACDDAANPPVCASTPTQTTSSTSTSACKTATSSSVQGLPFKFPSVWSEHTTKCLSEKRVTPEVRKDMVHTLSVMLTASTAGTPTALDCERVANAIVSKYPFLADPFGKSQAVSIIFNRVIPCVIFISGVMEDKIVAMCTK